MILEKDEGKMGVIIILFVVMYYVCHVWLGFSLLTTIFMTLSIIAVTLTYFDIKGYKEAKRKIKQPKKYEATVIDKEVIHGYHGRTTYTFELNVDGQVVPIKKDNVHRDLEENATFEVYPVYNEEKNVIDFDFADVVEKQTKIYMPFILFAIGTTATSVLFILNDHTSVMSVASTIVGTLFIFALLLFTGIYSMRRALVDKHNLTPAKAVIHSLRIHHRITDYGATLKSISPIYRVDIDGETYQFLGEKSATEEDKGKEVTVYYDERTMEFFDNPKGKSDLILGIVMIALAFLLLRSLVKELF